MLRSNWTYLQGIPLPSTCIHRPTKNIDDGGVRKPTLILSD